MKYIKILSYKYELYKNMIEKVPELKGKSFSHEYFVLKGGKLTIKGGYAWDGCRGPTIDTKNTFIAGIVHDVLYQSIRKGFLPIEDKQIVDKIFYRLLRENGMSWLRANYFYLGVKWFGGSSLKPKKDGEEQERIYEV
jgi:hypothetical protein